MLIGCFSTLIPDVWIRFHKFLLISSWFLNVDINLNIGCIIVHFKLTASNASTIFPVHVHTNCNEFLFHLIVWLVLRTAHRFVHMISWIYLIEKSTTIAGCSIFFYKKYFLSGSAAVDSGIYSFSFFAILWCSVELFVWPLPFLM